MRYNVLVNTTLQVEARNKKEAIRKAKEMDIGFDMKILSCEIAE